MVVDVIILFTGLAVSWLSVSLVSYAKLGLFGVDALDIIDCCIMMVSFLPALSIKIAIVGSVLLCYYYQC